MLAEYLRLELLHEFLEILRVAVIDDLCAGIITANRHRLCRLSINVACLLLILSLLTRINLLRIRLSSYSRAFELQIICTELGSSFG